MPKRHILGKLDYMAQSDALYQSLTGYENLAFFAQMTGLKKAELAESINQVAAIVDLTAHLGKKENVKEASKRVVTKSKSLPKFYRKKGRILQLVTIMELWGTSHPKGVSNRIKAKKVISVFPPKKAAR